MSSKIQFFLVNITEIVCFLHLKLPGRTNENISRPTFRETEDRLRKNVLIITYRDAYRSICYGPPATNCPSQKSVASSHSALFSVSMPKKQHVVFFQDVFFPWTISGRWKKKNRFFSFRLPLYVSDRYTSVPPIRYIGRTAFCSGSVRLPVPGFYHTSVPFVPLVLPYSSTAVSTTARLNFHRMIAHSFARFRHRNFFPLIIMAFFL